MGRTPYLPSSPLFPSCLSAVILAASANVGGPQEGEEHDASRNSSSDASEPSTTNDRLLEIFSMLQHDDYSLGWSSPTTSLLDVHPSQAQQRDLLSRTTPNSISSSAELSLPSQHLYGPLAKRQKIIDILQSALRVLDNNRDGGNDGAHDTDDKYEEPVH